MEVVLHIQCSIFSSIQAVFVPLNRSFWGSQQLFVLELVLKARSKVLVRFEAASCFFVGSNHQMFYQFQTKLQLQYCQAYQIGCFDLLIPITTLMVQY